MPTEAKAKTRPADEQKPQADFAAYMAALAQPVKMDAPATAPAKQNDTPVTEKAGNVQTAAPGTATTDTQTSTAQKAGHEAAGERSETTKNEREAAEPKAVKAQPVRSDKELLEALGLITRKSPLAQAEAVQKIARPVIDPQSSTAAKQKTSTEKADKNQIAATTLQQLQKAPDLILANADGLKRLGEKLGLAFLGKVSEKLGEKQPKAEGAQNNTRSELKTEMASAVTTTKLQKAGDGQSEQNTAFQNQQKSTKGAPAKIVSRETLAADTAEKPAPLGGSDLKPVSLPETATGRLATAAAGETRLAESVSQIRASENIRTAVENPLMRADLVRQFNEVMSRAQVLVADSKNAEFSVKLYPRDLGRMEIDLKMVDGEIRGKIVVESEDVKSEMQNYLEQREQSSTGEQIDLNRIDIEVRSGNQHAQNPERTPEADTLLQNLVTRAATSAYEMTETSNGAGSALYA